MKRQVSYTHLDPRDPYYEEDTFDMDEYDDYCYEQLKEERAMEEKE